MVAPDAVLLSVFADNGPVGEDFVVSAILTDLVLSANSAITGE